MLKEAGEEERGRGEPTTGPASRCFNPRHRGASTVVVRAPPGGQKGEWSQVVTSGESAGRAGSGAPSKTPTFQVIEFNQ